MFTDIPTFGLFFQYPLLWSISGIVLITLVFAWHRAKLLLWTLLILLILWGYAAPLWLWIVFAAWVVFFNIPPVRSIFISYPIMKLLKSIGFLPSISETEKIALEAGKNWFEGDYFTGRPRFNHIIKEPWPELTDKEQQFIDGPVREVCRMTNDWEVHKEQDLSPEVWAFLKKEGFFGMVIPEKFGGHGFSAYAMNRVVQMLGSRSVPLAVDVMVPNSLGPAELLVHYGTEKQQEYYLPRLARGEEIPAFALTEPNAGSDASSIQASGIVYNGPGNKPYIRLNWDKRYITLASSATLLGLAFQLEDPDNLLGKGTHPGITCALIPTNLPGIKNDTRHSPLGIPFINSPVRGVNVEVAAEQIIGGAEQAGNGWKMLMETLAGGRGIYLPALGIAGTKFATRLCGGYSAVREQFGLPIGKFEGVKEILAKIGGINYMADAFNTFTCGAIDNGHSPAVISAVVKYMGSELNRQSVNHAMDIFGGKGIIMGPENLLAHGYISAPIAITVEGSNVLTRSLIIFGQGLISCHPFAFKLMDALQKNNRKDFDKYLWKYTGMIKSNTVRTILLSLSRGRLAGAPVSGAVAPYYKKLKWASSTFSIMADLGLLTMGAALKQKEQLSGRFADVFSWLYICTSVLRKYEAEGRRKSDLPFVHWTMQYGLYQIQQSMQAIFRNFRAPLIGPLIRGPIAFWSRANNYSSLPSDKVSNQIAEILQRPGKQRDRLTHGIYIPGQSDEPLAKIENALLLIQESYPVRQKLKKAVKYGMIKKGHVLQMTKEALGSNLITPGEANLIRKTEDARNEVIKVDEFPVEGFKNQIPGLPDVPNDQNKGNPKRKARISIIERLKGLIK